MESKYAGMYPSCESCHGKGFVVSEVKGITKLITGEYIHAGTGIRAVGVCLKCAAKTREKEVSLARAMAVAGLW